ncbi:hypothetical protein NFI96_027119 [Prochilodus magdalenae]|nr:hypothetical protein NFI96_027119 [Prochilodus magdalenae]
MQLGSLSIVNLKKMIFPTHIFHICGMLVLSCCRIKAIKVIGLSTSATVGNNARMFCQLVETKEKLTRITWQKKTRGMPINKDFFVITPDGKTEKKNGLGDRTEFIGNIQEINGTILLKNVLLPDEGVYTCIFNVFPSGPFEAEIDLTILEVDQKLIQDFVDWCLQNHLQINAGKTKELVDFRRTPELADPPQAPGPFTDESRFHLSTCDRRDRLWRCREECYATCNIIQHDWFGGGSVMVWGGIFLEGRTDLSRLDNGTLTAIRHQDEILGPVVRPYAGAVGPGFLLVHNYARPHVARVCRQFLENEVIDAIEWPTGSPDLNPIEHVWDHVITMENKCGYTSKCYNSLTKSDFITSIRVIGLSTSATVGNNARMFCQLVETKEKLTRITWQKKTRGMPINKDFIVITPDGKTEKKNGLGDRTEFIGNIQEINGTILLKNVLLPDEGVYTCIFNVFPSGPFEAGIDLKILAPPDVYVSTNVIPVVGDSEVTLATCTAANALPAADVSWHLGTLSNSVKVKTINNEEPDGTFTVKSHLIGVPSKHLNQQKVRCLVRHPGQDREVVKDYALVIHYPPQVVYIKSVTDSTTTSQEFLCVTDANPQPTRFIWSRMNEILPSCDDDRLTIQLTSDNNGLYMCNVLNPYGNGTGTLYVHIFKDANSTVCWTFCFILPTLLIILCGIIAVYKWRTTLRSTLQNFISQLRESWHSQQCFGTTNSSVPKNNEAQNHQDISEGQHETIPLADTESQTSGPGLPCNCKSALQELKRKCQESQGPGHKTSMTC